MRLKFDFKIFINIFKNKEDIQNWKSESSGIERKAKVRISG